MKLPEALLAAIEVFRDLGWADASPEQVMELPLGTPEQRRIAKAGLAKGAWGEFGQVDERSYGWISWLDVDGDMLGVFAIRAGVPAARALAVMPTIGFSPGLRAELIASRGPDFVSSFIGSGRRARWYNSSLIYAVAVTGANTPDDLAYLESWAAAASVALGALPDQFIDATTSLEVIEMRYADHLRAALRGGIPAPSWAAELVGGGVERGWIDRDEGLELVLFAMEQAQRPIDRKTWAAVLVDVLGATPEWLLARAGVIVSVMSFGDDAIINRFAPVLLSSGDDELVQQTMLIGLTAKSAKTKGALLEAAAAIPAPSEETAAMVAESIAPLLDAKDRKVRKWAGQLVEAWGLEIALEPEPEPEGVRGLWCSTPPLAEVPRFDPGPETSEHLTELASVLMMSKSGEVGLEAERLLATANALARRDIEAVRTALRGVKDHGWGLSGIEEWVKGKPISRLDRPESSYCAHPFAARNASVLQRLGSVGVLLSTPSWDDYRIDPAELADRLDSYAEAGEHVLEADLQVALPRIDLDLVTPETATRLDRSRLPVLLQDGRRARRAAGRILREWLRRPAVHPGHHDEHATFPRDVAPVPALEDLPPRLTYEYLWAPIQLFPNWPDAHISSREATPATLRKRPNGPVCSAQLLNNVGEEAVDLDSTIAAWNNGVLLPGVAEAVRLGWRGQIPSLAARAEGWAELAEAGLLSVIWPLAADTIAYSSRGARVAPGVVELIELLTRFLPEVQAAIAAGIAEPEALALPGVRAVAQRGGSSRAVVAARALVELLPEAEPPAEAESSAMSEPEFAEAWAELADPDVVPDGATLEVEQRPGLRGGSYLEPVITLHDGSVHRVTDMYWAVHPLTNERQLMIGDNVREGVWLRFSDEAAVLALEQERRYDSRIEDDRVLSHTLSTVLCLTQFVQPDEPEYDFYAAIADGALGTRRVTAVIDELLTHDAIDPYRLVRRLSRHPEALPALYPVLTRSIRHAAGLEGTPPRWLVRIIDIATEFAPVLREASARELIPVEHATWPGLAEVARSSGSPTAKKKAALLLEALGLG